MNILEKLNIVRHPHSEIMDFCIQTIRFRKLLENANALLDLFKDGNEKSGGDYILDRRYVTSLIDGVVEKLGMIVYDGCVLSPENGEALYRQYDRHKLKAGNLIGQTGASDKKKPPAGEGSGSSPVIYPEYQLLSDALIWFNGKTSEPTAMDLIRQTLFAGIRGIESMDILKKGSALDGNGLKAPGGRMYLVDLWKGAPAPRAASFAPNAMDSIPLKLLFMDAAGASSSGQGQRQKPATQKPAKWIAAASEYEISLNALTPDFSFRLDATASGYETSDYIFIFADSSFDADRLLPPGFHTEKTDRGRLAWMLDVSAKTIEDSLITIGRNLFSGSAGRN